MSATREKNHAKYSVFLIFDKNHHNHIPALGVEPTESNDIKRAASEIMATAVRQTEERVAEVRRRAEDAVNQVNK